MKRNENNKETNRSQTFLVESTEIKKANLKKCICIKIIALFMDIDCFFSASSKLFFQALSGIQRNDQCFQRLDIQYMSSYPVTVLFLKTSQGLYKANEFSLIWQEKNIKTFRGPCGLDISKEENLKSYNTTNFNVTKIHSKLMLPQERTSQLKAHKSPYTYWIFC